MTSAVFYWIHRPQQLGWRIANLIANVLEIELHTNESPILPTSVDTFIYVNGLDAFADPIWQERMCKIAVRAEHFVFVQNDYMLRPPVFIRKAYEEVDRRFSPIFWSTIPIKIAHSDQWIENHRGAHINWNAIGYRYMGVPTYVDRYAGLFYYGDLRNGRSQYLFDYFGDHVPYGTVISAPVTSHRDFRKLLGDNVHLSAPITPLYEGLKHYSATVYIEDQYSHSHYTSPATRFYECLSAGVAQFIDAAAVGTLMKDFTVLPYVVQNAADVNHLLKSAPEVARKQQEDFAAVPSAFQAKLQNDILKAYSAVQ